MATFTLPGGYEKIRTVNLLREKKLALGISLAALAIAAGLFLPGRLYLPLAAILRPSAPGTVISLAVLAASFPAYIVCHELVHGLFIRLFSGHRAKYGFNWAYAYAGSNAYFTMRQYVVIALSPVVFFGVIFFALGFLVPDGWFWHVFLLQITNLSGAAGDYYITGVAARMPPGALAQDTGFEMAFFAREHNT